MVMNGEEGLAGGESLNIPAVCGKNGGGPERLWPVHVGLYLRGRWVLQ